MTRICGCHRIGEIVLGLLAVVVVCASVAAQDAKTSADKPTAPADSAPAVSAAEMLAKHGLLGTFAQQCAPPTRQNAHIVHRANGSQVDRHVLTGETAPTAAATIDTVTEQGGKRLQISQVGAGGRVTYTIEIGKDQFRTFESKLADGKVLIADGRFTSDNTPTQWLVKCPP
jgi:hypothetical protein